ncbi:MAG: TetR/AcrR family transcriptional regulator [Mitsuokella sp.]
MSMTAENRKILEDKRTSEIQAAAKKLFSIYGYYHTSMDSVAVEAGISKGLIYHYFKNKEDLLLSFSDEVEEYLHKLKKEKNPVTALKRFGTDFLTSDESKYADMPPIQLLLITFANQEMDISKYEKQNPILRDFGRGYLGGFFQQGIDAGIFQNGNAKVYGDIYWSFLMGKLLPIKKGNEKEKPEVYVDEILTLFIKKKQEG